MPNIKFSDFTFEAPNGTAQLVGYRSTVNFRTDTTSLSSGLGIDFVDLISDERIAGSKLFTSTLKIGEPTAASLSTILLYTNSSVETNWVFNGILEDSEKTISFRSNNSKRWDLSVLGTDQNFYLNYYSDAGVTPNPALLINRASGQVYIPQSLRLDGSLRLGGNTVVLSNAELQRLSGLSSNLQAQIGAKQNSIAADSATKILDYTVSFRDIVPSDVPALATSKITTGTLIKGVIPKKTLTNIKTSGSNVQTVPANTEVNIVALTIPSGTLSIGDVIKINFAYTFVGTAAAGTKTARIRIGSAVTTSGTGNIVGFGGANAAGVLSLQGEGVLVVTSATTLRYGIFPNPSYGVNLIVTSTFTIPNINTTNTVLSFNGFAANTTQAITLDHAYVEIIKP